MSRAWAVTVLALVLALMCLVTWNTPAGWACGLLALLCGTSETRRGLGKWREARRRRRGWTAEDEAILAGERELR